MGWNKVVSGMAAFGVAGALLSGCGEKQESSAAAAPSLVPAAQTPTAKVVTPPAAANSLPLDEKSLIESNMDVQCAAPWP